MGTLSKEEIHRYSRHIVLPEVGIEGQEKLKAASVLCVGAGGLGSPLSLYLAAAGVGRLGLVDGDAVDLANLQRQVAHGVADVGRGKVVSAREALLAINPEIEVVTHEVTLDSGNALDLLRDWDVIADGTDNFPTRYLINDACVLLGKPNVYGAVFRFEGQASVLCHADGPCYRCLYPDPPPPGVTPSCNAGGVFGVLPGVIGLIQATETIKLILGAGESLVGRLCLYDALALRFREMTIRRDPACPVCGEEPTVTELVDYEGFCGVTAQGERRTLAPEFEIGPRELGARLAQKKNVLFLDVREPGELSISRIEGALSIPLSRLAGAVGDLERGREIVVVCRTGERSAEAVNLLREHGFTNVKNLKGGINAWAVEVDPTLAQY